MTDTPFPKCENCGEALPSITAECPKCSSTLQSETEKSRAPSSGIGTIVLAVMCASLIEFALWNLGKSGAHNEMTERAIWYVLFEQFIVGQLLSLVVGISAGVILAKGVMVLAWSFLFYPVISALRRKAK